MQIQVLYGYGYNRKPVSQELCRSSPWLKRSGPRHREKVTANYQVTIPVHVRREMGILPGTEVDIKKEGQKHVLIVDPIETIRKKWRGRFKVMPTTMEYMDEVRITTCPFDVTFDDIASIPLPQ